MQSIDDHRRELLNNYYNMMQTKKPFLNIATWKIEDIFKNDSDASRFSREEMPRGYKGFLKKQKGISPNRVTDTWTMILR